MHASVRQRFDSLVADELRSADALRADLDRYLDELAAAFTTDGAVFNYDLARAIGAGCHELLERFEQLPEDQRRAVQAAVVYFIEQDDDHGDLDSVLGFDDDAELFNDVAASLGRYDLVVSLA